MDSIDKKALTIPNKHGFVGLIATFTGIQISHYLIIPCKFILPGKILDNSDRPREAQNPA